MIRLLVTGTLLLSLCGCGSTKSADAGNIAGDEAGQPSATGSSDIASQNLAFWADRWWNTANPDETKGAFVDMVPTDFRNEHFRVVFKKDVNDSSPREADRPTSPSSTKLDFTLGAQKKSFAMVTGKESGVLARVDRQRCIILSPDKVVYCAATLVQN